MNTTKLEEKDTTYMHFENSLSFAQALDAQDSLAQFRSQFIFPQHKGKDVIYLTGNSLGLQPQKAKELVDREMTNWAQLAVDGHFKGDHPWYSCHERINELMAPIVGAQLDEVAVMNTLTANLHFLLVSFYRPEGKRRKILCEAKAFPSDQYLIETQLKHHGLDPEQDIIEIQPRSGEHNINEEDIYAAIEEHKDELALVFIGGINYYTGQLFDLETICKKGQEAGAVVGYDLAHAAGNVPLKLHDWNVDFASWCTYKYMNSGPGSIAAIFVHERHIKDPGTPRFAGWWGYEKETRFLMEKGFKPMLSAQGWQMSNPPVLSLIPILASMEIFNQAGMENLRSKSILLTNYLEFLLQDIAAHTDLSFDVITPKHPEQRGSQLSMLTGNNGKALFDHLTDEGVIGDWREPNVIRMAPVPLYTRFEDMYNLGQKIRQFSA